jgi:alpha-tubulin suppressor-like RCC1 family protein/type II secretory pathway pseudopilin PulG
MFPGMSLSFVGPLAARSRRILRSSRGAFDLPSIIAGVVVVGILTAGVLAAVFGVIPFAQENAAKQDLAAIRTAEGVARAKDGKFMDSAGLVAAGYLSSTTFSASSGGAADGGDFIRAADVTATKPLAVDANDQGTCYVSVAKAPTGKLFVSTSLRPEAFTVGSASEVPECLDSAAMLELFAKLPGSSAPVMAPAGAVSSWGTNTNKALGNDSAASFSLVPGAVGAMAGKSATKIAAGGYFSCAIADGAAYCWGDNGRGQLGNNSVINSGLPVAVDATGVLAGKTVTAISAGSRHACAVADGAAYCWGDNAKGELGNGTYTNSLTPVAVTATGALAGKTVTAISAGNGDHTCVIADGAVYCWGDNGVGQVGNGITSVYQYNVPVAVVTSGVLAGKTVTSITSGSSFSCALAGGAVYCWGMNNYRQLGGGGGFSSAVPTAVNATGALAGKTVTAIGAGSFHACAVADGAAYCWGYNADGGLGIGYESDTPTSSPTAVVANRVLAGKKVTSIAGGAYGTCVVADGAAYCWGMNNSGQLGINDPTRVSKAEPVAVTTDGVLAGKTVTDIAAGYYHSVALYK